MSGEIRMKTGTFDFINTIALSLLTIVFLLPFILVFSTSFVSEQEMIRRGVSYVLLPKEITFSAYKVLFGYGSRLYNAYYVTIFVVVAGTFLNIAFTSTMSYALSKKSVIGNKAVTFFVFITMIFNGGLIPTYALVTGIGLRDSLFALIIPVLISPWYLFILRNFFMQVPNSMEESALIDGATPIIIFLKIMIPLSLPALATIGLFYAVDHWNSWFPAAIYINDNRKMPLQILLRNVITASANHDISSHVFDQMEVYEKPPDISVRSAMIIVSTVPILMVYPFIQKFFVKGVMVGSIKG